MFNPFGGMPVVIDNNLSRLREVQFRFPRSKKKRIRKKWGKDMGNFKTVPWRGGYAMNGTLVISPDMLPALESNIVQRKKNKSSSKIHYILGGINTSMV